MTSPQSSTTTTTAAEWLPNEQILFFFCAFLQTFHCVACFQMPLNYKWSLKRQHCQDLVPWSVMKAAGSGGQAMGRIMHCLSTHGVIPPGEWLYWAITASARQHWIVLLFWQWSSEGVFHNEFLLIFLVMSSNCMWLESWLLFSHLHPEVPLLY